MSKIIITGGPGSGKTSLINELKSLNYHCSPEASRELIIEQVAKKSDCLPWINLSPFAELVLERMISLYKESSSCDLTFFDRGIPDIIAYLKSANLPVSENYLEALANHRYHSTVFILLPWPEIYVNDNERWQTYKESEAIYQVIKETYIQLNFNLIEIPQLALERRLAFILEHIAPHITKPE